MCPQHRIPVLVCAGGFAGGFALATGRRRRWRNDPGQAGNREFPWRIGNESFLQDHPVSSREQWLDARRRLLAREKQLTRLRDQVAAERRELPWVRVDKDYRFQGERGERSLAELFGGNSQLIVYHFMFAPGWAKAASAVRSSPTTSTAPTGTWRTTTSAWWRYRARPWKSSRRSAGAWAGVSTGTPRTAAISTVTSGCPSTRRNWPPAASTTTTSRPRRRRGNAGCQRVPAQSGGRGVPHLFGLCARPRRPAHHLHLPRPDAQGAQRNAIMDWLRHHDRYDEAPKAPAATRRPAIEEHGEPLRRIRGAVPRGVAARAGDPDPPARRFRAAEEACTTPSSPPSSSGRATVSRATRAPGWFRWALQGHRQPAPASALRRLAATARRATGRAGRGAGGGRCGGRRPATPDLHLLPPGADPEAQVALTLREVCDLRTEEIARAFLAAPSAIAQRIVRAKNKIREARIPYQVPTLEELPERLGNVLQVIYLVFNEGLLGLHRRQPDPRRSQRRGDPRRPPAGRAAARPRGPRPARPDVAARLAAPGADLGQRRTGAARRAGPRSVGSWTDRRGARLVERAWPAAPRPTPCRRRSLRCMPRRRAPGHRLARIVALYDALLYLAPSPVVELNRAVALAMRDGVEVGLAVVDALLARGELADYHLAHSARADFCRRLGRRREIPRALAWRARSRSGASSSSACANSIETGSGAVGAAVRASPPTPRVNHQNARAARLIAAPSRLTASQPAQAYMAVPALAPRPLPAA